MKIAVDLCQPSSSPLYNVIQLVQGDTKPYLILNLTEDVYNTTSKTTVSYPLDVSTANVAFKIKPTSSNVVTDIVNCILLPGLEYANGYINMSSPYNVPGYGGRVMVAWNENSLSIAGQSDGEVQVTFADQKVRTVYNNIPIEIKEQF